MGRTLGCRILEFDEGFEELVELWDVGSSCPEKLFSVFRKDVAGVVLCYNPEQQNQIEQLDSFWESFSPRVTGLRPEAYMMCQV